MKWNLDIKSRLLLGPITKCSNGLLCLVALSSFGIAGSVYGQTKQGDFRTPLVSSDSLKNQASQKFAGSISNLKSPMDSFSFKDKFNATIRRTNLNGYATLESFMTSFQNPRVLSESKYVRFSSFSNLDLFGLPFTADIYYTTEENTLFNSNHFSVSFDNQRFMDNNTQNYKQNIEQAKTKLDYKQYQTVLLEKSQKELEKQKADLEANQKEYENKLSNLAQKERERVSDSIEGDRLKGVNDTFMDSLNTYNLPSRAYSDSVEQKREAVRNEIARRRLMADTHRLAKRCHAISKKLDSANLKYQELKQEFGEDSAKLASMIETYNDPKAMATAWLGEQKQSKLAKVMSNVSDFNIGNFTSMNHPLSTYGMTSRGLQIGYDVGKTNIGLDIGKTIPNDLSSYDRTNSSFDRNVAALSISTVPNKRLTATVFGHYLFDPKEKRTKEDKQAFVNTVYGTELESQILKNLRLKGNLAKSKFFVSNRTGISGEKKVEPYFTSFRSQSAYDLEAVSNVSKSTELEAKYSYVGPNFRNLGNPFMRVNFLEYRASLKQGLFKRQIRAKVFYKQLSDNPLKVNETTNTTSGYGFSISSRFKNRKLPNFNFQISPYEQGNNHPDSLFRVNNQFQLIMGGITYFRQIKSVGINAGVFGSNSVSQLSDSFLASVNTINGYLDLSLGQNLTIGGGITAIRSKPYMDSSHVDVYQLRINYKLGKRVSIGADAFMSDYASGSYRKGAKLQLGIQAKKGLSITLQSGYDKYFRLWGIEDAEAWSGLLRVVQRF